MATDVIMPQMGESIAEGTITKWLKNVGDIVGRDEPLFEISTDKVDAEIPSPAAGTLVEILVKPGDTVAINTIVGRIGDAGEKPAAPAAPAEAPAPAAKAPATEATVPAPEAPPAQPPAKSPTPAAPAAAPPPAPAAAPAVQGAPSASNLSSIEERIRTRSSPLVRKIAQENGVDIAHVEGTGIAGRVTKNDILSFVERGKAEPAAARPATTAPAGARDQILPMSVMRRKIAERMVESKRTSAHVATVFSVDYSNIARLRQKNKDSFFEKNGTKLTYMPFIFQAVTTALKKYPDLNASIDGEDVVHHGDVNLGMAVALDWGLIVPVIKGADEKSILGLARAANDLAERARTKKLKPEEVTGGTFTVTNPGVFGSLFGTPIIVQPQVAILGVGAIEKRPVVVEDDDGQDALGIRTMGYLALSFDHRLVDGAVADQFMAHVKKTLEEARFSLA
jgi:pyruvate dehydrogenase E2 component (dihydrolipoamide acetyltransferase)